MSKSPTDGTQPGHAIEARRRLQRQLDDRPYYGLGAVPPPPYQFEDCRMVWASVAVDAVAARALVPAGLELSAAPVAAINIWRSATTRYFGAVTGMLVAIEIEGFDAPDGTPGLYICAQYFSEPALAAVRPAFSAVTLGMDMLDVSDFEMAPVVATADGEVLLSMSMRPLDAVPAETGMLNYVSQDGRGELISFDVPYNFRCVNAELVNLAFGKAMPDRIRALNPRGTVFAYDFETLNFSFGVPVPVLPGPIRVQPSVGALLEHIGRAAAIVSAEAGILHANRAARDLLGDGPIRASNVAEQLALETALANAVSEVDAQPSGPFPFSLRGSSRQLIAQLIPLRQRHYGQPVALMLVTDPKRPPADDAVTTLELLGLTSAEARLAATIGGGRSPAEAAKILSITENTARTSLHIIYDKLGVRRMSGLVRLVTLISGS